MCGRIIRKTSRAFIAQDLGMEDDNSPDLPPRFNIPPGSRILVLRNTAAGRELVTLRWGLIPSWAKDEKIGWKMINARAETLAEKPAFREALRWRRCLIPVDGFYEWQKTADGKTPYFIRTDDERPFYLAGLWERWNSPAGENIESCTIVTTSANATLTAIHDRMPVIIPREQMGLWLDPNMQEAAQLEPLLVSFPPARVKATTVSRLVNDPNNDNEACLAA